MTARITAQLRVPYTGRISGVIYRDHYSHPEGRNAYCDNDVEGLSWRPTAMHVHVSLRRTRCCVLNKPRLVLRLTNRAHGHKLV